MTESRRSNFLTLALLMLLASPALAHKASDSFLYLDTNSDRVRIDVALRDLALLLPIDTNKDRQVTGGELRQHRYAIEQIIKDRVVFSSGAQTCELTALDWGVGKHSDGAYAAAQYQIVCPDGASPDRLDYTLLFDRDSLHRGLVQVSSDSSTRLAVMAPDKRRLDLSPAAETGAWQTFSTFVTEGVVHLLIGLDHILFLLVLMLPATLRQPERTDRGTRWLPARQQLWELAGIVTAFTLAHSITLSLAALKLVSLPIAWVETVIAASIAVAAVNVVWPILGRHTWRLAFGFGLVHGFGFASVLSDLTVDTSSLAIALGGFNVGVELGQLALIALGFPLLAIWARATPLYQKAVVPALLVAVMGISLVWVWQRIPAV